MDIHALEHVEPWEWPSNASQVILDTLRSPDATEEDRALAAHFAGEFVVINETLAEELMAIVKDPNQPALVRARAAISFGPALEHSDSCEWDDPDDILISEETFARMKQTLREVYENTSAPKIVRRRALEGAVRAPEDWQTDVVRGLYTSFDAEWKLTAVFAMNYVRGFDDEILDALGSEDSDIHFEAVCAAGANEVEEAWPHVLRILESGTDDVNLLIAAIEAAPYVNPEDAGTYIVDYTNSDDEDVAETASDALEMISIIKATRLEGDDIDWDEDLDDEDLEDEELDVDESLDEEDDEVF